MPTIILITDHFSNSAEMLKFRNKRQITRLGSKFRGLRKTVGPIDDYCITMCCRSKHSAANSN